MTNNFPRNQSATSLSDNPVIQDKSDISPQTAFDNAIKQRRLSNIKSDDNYAGNYMYMGYWKGKYQFKNINTRQYIE